MASMVHKKHPRKGVDPSIIRNNHVVRVQVLGLAGITVDRMKCRDKTTQASSPAHPAQMKSLVAFSRNSVIKGMTTLSKPLTLSPSDDIVMGQQGKRRDDETATDTTRTSDRPQRHVAVWTTDTGTIGSVVSFEANLQPIGKHKFAPLSFDLTIALMEDDKQEMQVALPFGVSTLAISGNECVEGQSIQLDLPVISLASARPLANKGAGRKSGFSGYPMIAISPLPKDMPTQRNALQRLFRRQRRPKVPNEAARHAFASAYSVDAAGDAILRVSLQVYIKGSEFEKALRLRGDSSMASYMVSPVKEPSQYASSVAAPSDRDTRCGPNDDGDDSIFSVDNTADASYSLDDTNDHTFDGTYADTYEGDDEDQSAGSGTYATNDDKLGFFAWDDNERKKTEDDTYTLSFEKKIDIDATPASDDPNPPEIDFFGRKIQLPLCASLPSMSRHPEDTDSVISRKTKGRLKQMVDDFRDDLTHVTADFFGRSYNIPVCSGVKAFDDYDDEEYTLFTEVNTVGVAGRENQTGFLCNDQICRNPANPSPAMRSHEHSLFDGDAKQAKKETPVPVDVKQKVYHPLDDTPNSILLSPSTAKEWLMSSKVSPTKPQKSSKGGTNASPQSIHEFPHGPNTLAQQAALPVRRLPLAKSFTDFFGISPIQGEREAPAPSDHDGAAIPPVISPGDNDSVGDLTANTHEINIASESKILNRYRKKFREEQIRERNQTGNIRLLSSVPAVFGGDGMCLGSAVVESAQSPIRVASIGSVSVIDHKNQTSENYFAEYDDYSIAAPMSTGIQGRDPPPRDDDPNDVSVVFTPIEMTITGYHRP